LHIAERIVEERHLGGHFESLSDFVDRLSIGIEHTELLIFVGAFRDTGKPKNELVLEARMLINRNQHKEVNHVHKLFKEPVKKWDFPVLERNTFEDAFDEIEIVGFPVSCDPFDMLKTKYRGEVMVKDFLNYENKIIRIVGYLIARKDVPTVKGHMNFGTWIDGDGAFFDTTHFPDILYRWPFKGPGCYLIQGKVVVEFGFPSIEVEKVDRLPMVDDPRYDEQRAKVKLPDGSNISPSPLTRAPYPSKGKVDQLYGRKK
jgi:DNA polymerase-3 subunit alpha